jgi:small subunit ribosomal protein S8
MNELKCISKPGKPIYKSMRDLKEYSDLPNIYIVSTVEGLLKSPEAIEKGLGGILLCKISQ